MSKISRYRRFVYILMPLFFLLFCLGALNLSARLAAPRQAAASPPATADTLITPGQTTLSPAIAVTTTPISTPTRTPTPTPTIPPDAAITLLGPPPDASFYLDDTLAFFWQWPLPLAEGWQFSVYLSAGDTEWRLGSIGEPNVGDGYRLSAKASDVLDTAVPATWQVRLETADQVVLVASEARALTFIAPK